MSDPTRVPVPVPDLLRWARLVDDEMDLDGVSAELRQAAENPDTVDLLVYEALSNGSIECERCDGSGDYTGTCVLCAGSGELSAERLAKVAEELERLRVVEIKARGLIRTAHVEVGKREVVRQWWDALVGALGQEPTDEVGVTW